MFIIENQFNYNLETNIYAKSLRESKLLHADREMYREIN